VRIAVVSPFVPYEGIPHAGGEYVRKHTRALAASGHKVTVVAPLSADNLDAVAQLDNGVEAVLYETDHLLTDRRRNLVQRLFTLRRLAAHARSIEESPEASEVIARADAIEYQWTETGWIRVASRRDSPLRTKPSVVIAHDVIHQRERRARDAARHFSVLWFIRHLKLLASTHDERRIIGSSTAVLALSEKDATMLRSLYSADLTGWVNPPLDFSQEPRNASPEPTPRVLFVGAFHRQENASAAHWFLNEVWPLVTTQRPDARAVFAGASPDANLLARSNADPSIEVTGYLPRLDEQYQRAAVIVVPLHQGAGVKFKTISALLAGRPLVTTRVGIEGILPDDSPLVWAVADDPIQFAAGILGALKDPAGAAVVAEQARTWAAETYSERRFVGDIRDFFERLAPIESA